jgi:putative nucleotidyltransferase with HDIG domain
MNLTESIVQSMTKLPPFPAVIQRAIQLMNDPNSSAQQVVDAIQFDQLITANVLKICNSAYFGLRRTIHSLREALVMIGFNQLLEIILSQESVNFFSAPCKGYDLGYGELWHHSVASALLTRIVSKRLNREATPSQFTAALVHDIGKMAIGAFIKDYFDDIKKCVEEEHLAFTEAESKVLGINHAELGGMITNQWNFPKDIESAVHYHHTPDQAPIEDRDTVQLIYLCDSVAMMTGIGGGADGLSYHGYEEVMKQFGLKEDDIDRFVVQLDDRFELVKEVLHVKGDLNMNVAGSTDS